MKMPHSSARKINALFVVIGLFVSVEHLVRAQAQDVLLSRLLDRSSEYVADYHRVFPTVVCDEVYHQRFVHDGVSEQRVMRSEVALMTLSNTQWVFFRDVQKVDGKAVADGKDRLATLLTSGAEVGALAERLAAEASRFNLGGHTRTINAPTIALLYLLLENRDRVQFSVGGTRRFGRFETVELRFSETALPRLMQTRDDAPAFGAFWVEPHTGRVIASQLATRSEGVLATIDVKYALQDAQGGLLVPIEMVESYRPERSAGASTSGSTAAAHERRASPESHLEARATYSQFRRFSTTARIKLEDR